MKRIYLFACLVALYSCQTPSEQSHDHAEHTDHAGMHINEEQFKNAKISLGSTEALNMGGVLKVNGMISIPPQNLFTVSAKMGGFLKISELLQGSPVKKGQVLANVENQDFITLQQDYLDAYNRLEYWKNEYERQKKLAEENVNAQKIFQQASADYNALKSKIKALEARLTLVNADLEQIKKGNISNTYQIYSPTDGIITEVMSNSGKFVQPQDAIFEIADHTHIHAELTVFEQDLHQIKIGQEVKIEFLNQPNLMHKASVFLMNPKVDAQRTVRVHCHFDQLPKNIAANTFLKAYVVVENRQVNALPETAFVTEDGKDYVFALQEVETQKAGGKPEKVFVFTKVEVTKGLTQGNLVEVQFKQPIEQQTQIVKNGAFALLAQMKAASGEEHGHAH